MGRIIVNRNPYKKPRLLMFHDPSSPSPRPGSVWSQGPNGTLWIVPLDDRESGFVLVRKVSHRWVTLDAGKLPA